MAAFPIRYYQDPAKSVKFQRERNCRGCIYEKKSREPGAWPGAPAKTGRHCAIGNPHGRRCNSYLERPALRREEQNHGHRR